MAIYTKKGDKGETKVFDAKTGELKSISKKSCRIMSIGAVDELNSYLGIVRSVNKDPLAEEKILKVQGNLFIINSILAGSDLEFSKKETKLLEKELDKWEGSLPVLKNFIYYGGTEVSSHLLYARALCRKAERSLVRLSKLRPLSAELMAYINRLSDYLFMFARGVNFSLKEKEKYWITKK